jgi:predicted lipid-binding transport protein (Tim44 family)
VLCGAGAGLAGGLLAGGLDGALFFGAVAACWAAVFNWRSVRDSIAARAARSKLTKAKLR